VPLKKMSDIERETSIKKPISLSSVSGFTGASPTGLLRLGRVAMKSFYEDLPYLQQMHGIPKALTAIEPEGGAEIATSIATKLTRDISLWNAGGKAIGLASKLRPISAIGSATQHYGKYGHWVNKIVPEFAKGAMLGGLTSGPEADGLLKKAITFGAFTGAIPPVVSGVAWAGKGLWKVSPNIVKKPFQTVGEWLALSTKDSAIRASNLKRIGDIASRQIDDEVRYMGLRDNLTPFEKQVLPFYMERRVPPAMKKAIQLRGKDVHQKLAKYGSDIKSHLDAQHKFISDSMGGDFNYWGEHYLPHMWDIPKGKEQEALNFFRTLNPHTKKRAIDTIQAGMAKGYMPKHRNIDDLVRAYDAVATRVGANNVFAREIKDSGLLMSAKKAPEGWKTYNHPALNRVVATKRKGKILLKEFGAKVHPDIHADLEAVFGKQLDNKVINGLNRINAVAKNFNFMASLFHPTSLTESSIAIGNEKQVIPNLIKSLRGASGSGRKAVFENIPLTKDGVKHGLQVGAVIDVQRNLVEQTLANAENNLSNIHHMLGKSFAPLPKSIRAMNHWLWDYKQPLDKLTAYGNNVPRMLKRFPNLPASEVKEEVAQFVNDTFGGQIWELLGKSPQWKQFSHFLLLSPDWTVSTIRQALSPFGVGAVRGATRAVREELGKEFWSRAALYFIGGANLINHANTKAQTGEGRFIFENTPGKKDKLFLGFDDEGKEQYIRFGKQFREMFEWVNNPARTLGNKTSPVVRQAVVQMTGHQPSGYRTPVASARTRGAAIGTRAAELGKMFLPYSVNSLRRAGGNPVALAFPISGGLNKRRAKLFLVEALRSGNQDRIKEVLAGMKRNNLDIEKILKSAKRKVAKDKK